MKGENDTSSILPLDNKKGGPVRYFKDREAIYLTEALTRHIYKKVDTGSKINIDTIRQQNDIDRLTRNKTNEEEINLYQKIVLSKLYKDNTETVRMENWSILSYDVKYVQHDGESKIVHDLDVKTLDYRHHTKLYNKLKQEERQTLDMDSGESSHVLKPDYLDLYEGIHAEMVY